MEVGLITGVGLIMEVLGWITGVNIRIDNVGLIMG